MKNNNEKEQLIPPFSFLASSTTLSMQRKPASLDRRLPETGIDNHSPKYNIEVIIVFVVLNTFSLCYKDRRRNQNCAPKAHNSGQFAKTIFIHA